jgi:transposase
MRDYSTIVGLDLGDRYSYFCVMDKAGEIVEQGRVGTTPAALRRKFASMSSACIALEVCTYSPWVSRLLKSCGHEVLVANASRVALIYGTKRKRDPLDAETLARLARFDPELLRPIEHRGAQAQHDMAVLRGREALVKARTQLVNSVRSVMKSMGYRAPSCSTDCFHRKVGEQLPDELKDVLGPVVGMVGELTARIRQSAGHGYDVLNQSADGRTASESMRRLSRCRHAGS